MNGQPLEKSSARHAFRQVMVDIGLEKVRYGHSSVAASYYYMHSTPIVMDRIASACAALEQEGIS